MVDLSSTKEFLLQTTNLKRQQTIQFIPDSLTETEVHKLTTDDWRKFKVKPFIDFGKLIRFV